MDWLISRFRWREAAHLRSVCSVGILRRASTKARISDHQNTHAQADRVEPEALRVGCALADEIPVHQVGEHAGQYQEEEQEEQAQACSLAR